LENFDLHNHSTYSDGLLSPTELIELAARTGADAIALTDHDTTDGLAEAHAAAKRTGLGFVPGVEISVSWGDTTLHVVGLQVDPSAPSLAEGLMRYAPGAMRARKGSPPRSRSSASRERSPAHTRSRRTSRCWGARTSHGTW